MSYLEYCIMEINHLESHEINNLINQNVTLNHIQEKFENVKYCKLISV